MSKTEDEWKAYHLKYLNSKQFVFVLKAEDVVDLVGAGSGHVLAAVGWDKQGVAEAHAGGEAVYLVIFAVEDDDGGMPQAEEVTKELRYLNGCERADDALATWDHIFDHVLPFAARTGHQGFSSQGMWTADPLLNMQFLRQAQSFRREIQGWSFLPEQRDSTVGVAECQQTEENEVGSSTSLPSLSPAAKEDVVLRTRQTLHNLFYLNPLFRGDGYSYTAQGERKARELLIPTTDLSRASYSLISFVWEEQWGHDALPSSPPS